MAAYNRDTLIRQLRLHEGERLGPYRCTAGKLTIGVGRNLEDRGITRAESAMLLANDIEEMDANLTRKLPWVARLDDVRRRVLIDMAFNLGVSGLLEFKRTLAAVEQGRYQEAAGMMLQSRWASQVGERAQRLARMMLTGQDPQELLSSSR
jgi:lysozyme